MAKTIFYSLAALVHKILLCHSKIKFISLRYRVIFSLYFFIDLAKVESKASGLDSIKSDLNLPKISQDLDLNFVTLK